MMLWKLSELSESLQSDSMNLNKVHRLIVHQVEVFSFLKSQGGEHYDIATQAVVNGSFSGVPIAQSDAKCDKYINKTKLTS